MPRPDLSRLTSEEKDALILALLDRVAALEAKLGEPPKTPDNSSLPPSRGRKTNRPPRAKRPRRKRMGPGVTRVRAAAPDRTVACYAERCRHCGVSLDGAGQTLRQAYDHIDLPPVRPVVTRVAIFGRRCPCCRRRVRGVAPADMPPGSPFGASVQVMLAYLHHHHAIAYDRLSRLMGGLFGLQISEGAIANALHRAAKPLAQAGEVIAARLREAQVVGCDETGARLSTDALGTRMAWEWVLVSDRAVLPRIRPSRGRDVIDELMAGHQPRCWVADRWAAQQDRAETHQLCLAQFQDFALAADQEAARGAAAEHKLRARLESLTRADQRLLDAYQAEVISLDELTERRGRLTEQRQALDRQLETARTLRQNRIKAQAVATDLAAFCVRLHSRLDEASFADRQAILQLVIERIIVHEDRLEIRHVIPLHSPMPGGQYTPAENGRLRSDGVDGAALGRHVAPQGGQRLLQPGAAVDNQELRLAQAAFGEIVENGAPRPAGLAAPVLDGPHHLLAVLAHAEDDQEGDRGRLPVEPNPNHRAVQDQADDRFLGERAGIPAIPIALHLAPHPAHRILADRAAKHRCERPAHPTRVGPGKVAARDQRIGLLGSPLVSPQRLALPLDCLAVRRVEPGTRHRDVDPTKSPCQRPRAMAVPVARNAARAAGILRWRRRAASVTWA